MKQKPACPSCNVAMARAKIAVHAAARLRFPPLRFVKLLGILEDRQFFHGNSFYIGLYRARKGWVLNVRFVLLATPLPCPLDELLQLGAIFPRQAEKFAGC